MTEGATSFDAPAYVERMLQRAAEAGASDVHVEPIADGVEVRFRVDGVLEAVEKLPADAGRSIALRMMVLAQLLTYRLEIPQEGRIRWENAEFRVQNAEGLGRGPADKEARSQEEGVKVPLQFDLRVAMMPVAHGIRVVVRMPAELTQPRVLGELGLPAGCVAMLEGFARADAGMLLVTGPAGSGKTTTIYALLEYIAKTNPGLSIIALEDPIERLVPGITQIEVTPQGQLTYERALKSILRQDPQVLMLGEIRDGPTASVAIQAALSGHRLIATMHAGEPATAIARLLDMGLEPYQVTSSIYAVLTQRLLRKKVRGMGILPRDGAPLGAGEHQRNADAKTTYKGRVPVAEFGSMSDAVRAGVLAHKDAPALREVFRKQAGHVTLRESAGALAEAGLTDLTEVVRVLGE